MAESFYEDELWAAMSRPPDQKRITLYCCSMGMSGIGSNNLIIITVQLFGMLILFAAIVLSIYLTLDSSKGKQILETVCGTINTCVYIAPLYGTVKLIRTGCIPLLRSPYLPWIMYGCLSNDNTIMVNSFYQRHHKFVVQNRARQP